MKVGDEISFVDKYGELKNGVVHLEKDEGFIVITKEYIDLGVMKIYRSVENFIFKNKNHET